MLLYYFVFSIVFIGITFFSKSRKVSAVIAGAFIVMQVLFSVYILTKPDSTELGYFTFDALGQILMVILSMLCVTTYYHSYLYLKDEGVNSYNIFQAGFMSLTASITGVYLANNIMVSWIFMEATTLSVAVLIYHNRTIRTLEATWKYVFICSTGIAIAYVGILFLSTTVESISHNDMAYATLAQAVKTADPVYLKMAFLFLLVGFSAKMEFFPLHTIGIDANYVSPAPISAFISTALVNAGFCAIFRVYKIFSVSAVASWASHLMILTGLISLLVAAAHIQKVKNFKRLFAYSTVENMGLVLIAIGMGGIGYYAALLHIILHSFTKSSLFYQMGQAHQILQTYKIFKAGSYMKLYPIGGVVLLLGLLVITGMPPSGMFVSEVLIFKSIFANGHWWVFIVTAFLLCFVIYAMMSKVLQMLFTPIAVEKLPKTPVHPVQTISQYLFLGIAIWLCFYQPEFLDKIIGQAVTLVP
jgi:hydrogenase-4 component F